MTENYLSWGRFPYIPQKPHYLDSACNVNNALENATNNGHRTILPYGSGRSYGDCCLAESANILIAKGLDRIIFFDDESGVIRCQSGITFQQIIKVILPRGWFLPVTPGTQFVTLGGAIANDVHGKNHHIRGTFGAHVRSIILYRSDVGYITCSNSENFDLFEATIGGLGLTGIVVEVELSLIRIKSPYLISKSWKFENLEEFYKISESHDKYNDYSVAWIDCTASGKSLGRGHYITANHFDSESDGLNLKSKGRFEFPVTPSFSLINSFTLKVFNELYYHKQFTKQSEKLVRYDNFFYPLDRIINWNRIYGNSGFQQYQCVIPKEVSTDAIKALLKEISTSSRGSFLAVLKHCGNMKSPGLMSFPLHGHSLALDFPYHFDNFLLFRKLDSIVNDAKGRLYPAKDSHMSSEMFKNSYPMWTEIERIRDPLIMSRFWSRVTK